MASHNHFLISERGQRKETTTEGQYESRDKRKEKRSKCSKRGKKKRMAVLKYEVMGEMKKKKRHKDIINNTQMASL